VTSRQCGRCRGTGRSSTGPCRTCKGTGWIEVRTRRGGKPGSLTEASTLVTGPALLLEAAKLAAAAEGIDAIEWWRRAARARLGWREVLEEDQVDRIRK
jgi:hypothetical protein